jgi:hypothetical protein
VLVDEREGLLLVVMLEQLTTTTSSSVSLHRLLLLENDDAPPRLLVVLIYLSIHPSSTHRQHRSDEYSLVAYCDRSIVCNWSILVDTIIVFFSFIHIDL